MTARGWMTGVVVALIAFRGMAVEPEIRDPRADDGFAGLSLRVNDESAPAGSIVQIKIDVTEPKPISTGGGKIRIRGLANIEGIALMNRDQDTFGVALVDGEELTFAIHSPSGAFETPPTIRSLPSPAPSCRAPRSARGFRCSSIRARCASSRRPAPSIHWNCGTASSPSPTS